MLTNKEIIQLIKSLLGNKSKEEITSILNEVISKPSIHEFYKTLKIISANGFIKFIPLENQLEIFHSVETYKNTLVIAGRQMGTSLTGIIQILYQALIHEDSEIVIMTTKIDRYKDLIHYINYILQEENEKYKVSNETIKFENGSRITFITSNKDISNKLAGRFRSIDLFWVDDLNWMEYYAINYVIKAYNPKTCLFTTTGGVGNGNHSILLDDLEEVNFLLQPHIHTDKEKSNLKKYLGDFLYNKEYLLYGCSV